VVTVEVGFESFVYELGEGEQRSSSPIGEGEEEQARGGNIFLVDWHRGVDRRGTARWRHSGR
jgi:hypothetical protein